MADDSGLCVEALDGAPGVFSARFASINGENATDRDNVEKLLKEMENVPDEKRQAAFTCAISGILIRKIYLTIFYLPQKVKCMVLFQENLMGKMVLDMTLLCFCLNTENVWQKSQPKKRMP